MELIEFHFRAGLDFTGQFPGWREVENLPGFGVGKALDHAWEITKKENRRKRKSQIGMVREGWAAKVARPCRRALDKGWRKLDAKDRRNVGVWAVLSRSFGLRSRR